MAIDWQDEGVILQTRGFGERDSLVHFFTSGHGKHAGLVRGGQSKTQRAYLQTGNRLTCRWQARLQDQLGTWHTEPIHLYAGRIWNREQPLLAMLSACRLVLDGTGEREPSTLLYAGLVKLLDELSAGTFPLETYIRFELLMLSQAGFTLDFSKCAVTGVTTNLTMVSPRTGRAVCEEAAEPYRDRLLPLPGFLRGEGQITDADALSGLRLSGFFLRRHLFDPIDAALPAERERLVASLQP
jgi:DNA repair protein RecO (recombination protein O)